MEDENNIFDKARAFQNIQKFPEAEALFDRLFENDALDHAGLANYIDCKMSLGKIDEGFCLLYELDTRAETDAEKSLFSRYLNKHFRKIFENNPANTVLTHDPILRESVIDYKPPFYISSYGGSATRWLSDALNQIDELVCFHGTRSFPPIETTHLPRYVCRAEKFIEYLVESSKATGNLIHFGGVHGFHGLDAYNPIRAASGSFFQMIRHPINRINSLSVLHLTNILGISKSQNPFVFLQQDSCSSEKINLAEKRFAIIVRQTIEFDIQAIENLEEDQIIQYEKITEEPEELCKVVSIIKGRYVELDPEVCKKIYDNKNLNKRSSKFTSDLAGRELWCENLKGIFETELSKFGLRNVKRNYKRLGYNID